MGIVSKSGENGSYAKSDGQWARASGNFDVVQGSAQCSIYPISGALAGFLSHGATGTENLLANGTHIQVPNNSTWCFDIHFVARGNTGGYYGAHSTGILDSGTTGSIGLITTEIANTFSGFIVAPSATYSPPDLIISLNFTNMSGGLSFLHAYVVACLKSVEVIK